MKILILFSLLFINATKDIKASDISDKIVGTWLSEDKDLKVEIFNKKGHYFGKVVWFICDQKTPNMEDFKDKENPDPKLRNRKWLGLEVVENLTFNNKDAWENGTIYDPNSGKKYSSVVRLKNNSTLIVRSYWGIGLFGKNLEFHRVLR